MAKFLVTIVSTMLVQSAFGQDLQSTIDQLQSKSYDTSQGMTVKENQAVFTQYCTGDADSTDRPNPKYNNKLVASAAVLLQKSKTDADAKLQELLASSWENKVTSIQQELEALKNSPKPEIQKLAAAISSSLSIAKPGISAEQKSMVNDLAKIVMTDIEAAIPGIANIPSEFTAIDYNLLKSLVGQLVVKFQEQLNVVAVDINLVESAVTQMEVEVAQHSGAVDKNVVTDAFTKLRDAIKAMNPQPNSNESYLLEYLDSYIGQLPSMDETSLNWALRDILYYINPEAPYTPEAAAQFVVITGQWVRVAGPEMQTNLNNLKEMIAQYKAGTTTAGNLSWYVSDLSSNINFYALVSSNPTFISTAKAFTAHAKAVTSSQTAQGLIDSAKSIQAQLSDSDSQNDLNAVSSLNWMSYDIEQVKGQLDPSTLEVFAKAAAEAKKSEQESIKNDIQYLVDNFSNAPKTMEGFNEINYYVSNVAGTLTQLKAGLSPASQVAVDAFAAADIQARSIQNLYYYMVEDGTVTDSEHFYFYGGVKRIYKTYKDKPDNVGEVAHTFLVQLCGEFRDRATMIEAKLKWINRMYTLPVEQNVTSIDFNENIWKQVSSVDYFPYLRVTESLWHARKSALHSYITIGKYSSIDTPVVGPTVCETKYIFDKYVKQGKEFDDLETYTADYETNYRARCSADDQADYYDFRGDSNFKHYSPESNAMIWRALSVARACKSQTEAQATLQDGSPNQFDSSVCSDYFRRPFHYRYNSARSALATGLFYNGAYDSNFDSQGNAAVKVYSNHSPDFAPMAYDIGDNNPRFEYDADWLSLKAWNKPDIGFNEWVGMGMEGGSPELAYERLRGSVDRHTNWYSASYTDMNGDVRDQAFSPFVASSYVMQASDAFTTCGITVNCPPDGLRRWMFIFRIKPENWYNPQRLADGDPVDFDKMWFDETSFGDSGLANGENAWDRLGTAVESELDSILYLINVGAGEFGGEMEFEGDVDHLEGGE